MNKNDALSFYRESLTEIEAAGVKKNERIITTPQSAHIFADGKDKERNRLWQDQLKKRPS